MVHGMDQTPEKPPSGPPGAFDLDESDESVTPDSGAIALSCCRFRGHEDKIVTKELESGYDETEVQP